MDIILIATQTVGPADGSDYLISEYGPVLNKVGMDNHTFYQYGTYHFKERFNSDELWSLTTGKRKNIVQHAWTNIWLLVLYCGMKGLWTDDTRPNFVHYGAMFVGRETKQTSPRAPAVWVFCNLRKGVRWSTSCSIWDLIAYGWIMFFKLNDLRQLLTISSDLLRSIICFGANLKF